MTLSSRIRLRGLRLGGCELVAALVSDEGPQDVDAASGQGEDGLGMALTFDALAIVEASGFGVVLDTDQRRCVEDSIERSVIAARPVQVADDTSRVAGSGRQAGGAGHTVRS